MNIFKLQSQILSSNFTERTFWANQSSFSPPFQPESCPAISIHALTAPCPSASTADRRRSELISDSIDKLVRHIDTGCQNVQLCSFIVCASLLVYIRCSCFKTPYMNQMVPWIPNLNTISKNCVSFSSKALKISFWDSLKTLAPPGIFASIFCF